MKGGDTTNAQHLRALNADFSLEGTGNRACRLACVRAQRKYCEARELPEFQPWQGFCARCGRDIYGPLGYTLGQAASQLITGCPYCHDSFCE